ncbi:MAG: ligase-associated DNA damage response endonuclease PdeM [Pseudomonadota bacterium]
MQPTPFTFGGEAFTALPSGALWWEGASVLVVADLHLGKSQRIARRGGALLPPYDSAETLTRLTADIDQTAPTTVISLGDGFDDMTAAGELGEAADVLRDLTARTDWLWVAGNHDPEPISLGGRSVDEIALGGIAFRHIGGGAGPEISGHYHPKAALSLRHRRLVSPCFAMSDTRLVMPAYGTYTGGLSVLDPAIQGLFDTPAKVILTRAPGHTIPVERLCA